jgi:hypothetical protein
MTMITRESEKLDKASAGVSIPESISIINAHSATRSERTRPLMKNTIQTQRTATVINISSSSNVIKMSKESLRQINQKKSLRQTMDIIYHFLKYMKKRFADGNYKNKGEERKFLLLSVIINYM